MAINYTWNVVQMDAYPQHAGEVDVVFTVHWTLAGDDGEGHVAGVYGSTPVTYDAGQPYTPYADLTLDQVVGWVQAALGPEQVASLETNIAGQIEQQINPSVVTPPLPWSEPSVM